MLTRIRNTFLIVAAGLMLLLTGCAATQVAIEHKDLKANSKMSETIFLDPVPQNQKTVMVSIKNPSDKPVHIRNQVVASLKQKGYKVVNNPNHAHYLLQANILKVGEMNKAASQSALGGGYGSSLAGAVTGVAAGSLTGSANTAIGAGLAGGLLSMAADSLIKDVNFTMITDIQVSERVRGLVNESTKAHLRNGSATQTSQSSTRKSHFQRYRTRVVSNADKVNLKFAQARPALEAGLAHVVSGIF